jgi:hypothetical protein
VAALACVGAVGLDDPVDVGRREMGWNLALHAGPFEIRIRRVVAERLRLDGPAEERPQPRVVAGTCRRGERAGFRDPMLVNRVAVEEGPEVLRRDGGEGEALAAGQGRREVLQRLPALVARGLAQARVGGQERLDGLAERDRAGGVAPRVVLPEVVGLRALDEAPGGDRVRVRVERHPAVLGSTGLVGEDGQSDDSRYQLLTPFGAR